MTRIQLDVPENVVKEIENLAEEKGMDTLIIGEFALNTGIEMLKNQAVIQEPEKSEKKEETCHQCLKPCLDNVPEVSIFGQSEKETKTDGRH